MPPSCPRRLPWMRCGGSGITVGRRQLPTCAVISAFHRSGKHRKHPGQILDPHGDQVDHGPVALDPAGDAQQAPGNHRPAEVLEDALPDDQGRGEVISDDDASRAPPR